MGIKYVVQVKHEYCDEFEKEDTFETKEEAEAYISGFYAGAGEFGGSDFDMQITERE